MKYTTDATSSGQGSPIINTTAEVERIVYTIRETPGERYDYLVKMISKHGKSLADEFITKVCQAFNVDKSAYLGKDRSQPYMDMRRCVYHLLRYRAIMTLGEIGRIHGGRDHSTIINALNRFDQLIDRDQPMQRKYKTINKIFNQLNQNHYEL